MITEVEIKNYRAIAHESISLDKLTVLVGRNGAGKSTAIDALKFVRDATVTGLDNAVVARQGIASLRRWSPTKPFDVEIKLKLAGSRLYGEYGFVLGSGRDGEFRVKHEHAAIARSAGDDPIFFERKDDKITKADGLRLGHLRSQGLEPTSLALGSMAVFEPGLSSLRRFLQGMRFYSIFPNTLREPQKPSANRVLDEHGSNLASIVRSLKPKAKAEQVVALLDRVVGGVCDLRVEQVGGFLATQVLRKVSGSQEAWFDLAQESDGTLRLLGLLVALYQPAPTDFIALEEPELTLHPGALGVLSDILLDVAAKRQLLITTQSPDLIARFPAKSLRVVERRDGLTHIGPVSETQRDAINADLFSAGELLRIEGLRLDD